MVASPQHTTKQLSDLYAPRARDLAPPMYGAAQQGRAAPISLAFGLADPTLFPTQELAEVTAEVLAERPDTALNYGPTSPELYEQISERLQRQGIAATREQVLVSHGSGQLLGLLPEVLVSPGDTVIIEGPSFLGAVRRFEIAGAKIVTIPVDADGMDIDALEEKLAELARQRIRPKFIYTIPTFQNPTGTTMSLDRRRRLVALAATYGVLVVEDDAYSELAFDGSSVTTLASIDTEGWVVRVGTYSKILAPGVRLGWASGPSELIKRLAMVKVEGENGPFVTHVVSRFSADGRLDRHIAQLRERYRHKCQVMLAAIEREFPAEVQLYRPEGGFFLWCTLPQGVSAARLLDLSEERGVSFLTGSRCYCNGQGDDSIRLAFSYHSPEQIAEGIGVIGQAMRELW
ncbi:PLP-dependent aminotransferase family protein [Chloroflexia bacterium SDU3-3]|nr:PLP-dependent aminotransferase family protein [Chloroflexia bacterium SDU3-3]